MSVLRSLMDLPLVFQGALFMLWVFCFVCGYQKQPVYFYLFLCVIPGHNSPHTWLYRILTFMLYSYCHPHFTDRKIDGQRDWGICARAQLFLERWSF